MLSFDDTPTVRWAILRRLDKEPGVAPAELRFWKYHQGDAYPVNPDDEPEKWRWGTASAPFLRVRLILMLGDFMHLTSRFDLPVPFELGHVHDEIDEIAEQCKKARRDFFTEALPVSEEKRIEGTGLRGRWGRYGLRVIGG